MMRFGKLAHTVHQLHFTNMCLYIKYRLYCILCDEVVFVVKSIVLIFLMLLIVSGICEIIYIIKMLINYPGTRVENYSIIILRKNYALKQLNYIWQKIKWYGDSYSFGVIALTDALDNNEKSICSKYAFGKNITLCNTDSLLDCKFLQGDF